MGNITSCTKNDTTHTFTWGEGRMLLGVSVDASNNATYTYDASGLRRQKVVTANGQAVTTDFIWGNNGLVGFTQGDTVVTVLYDVENQPVGFTVNDAVYTYVKNIQGDVLKVLDSSGNTVISYSYDPWGVPTITGDTALAALNPCSYRGYYYDFETGFYYLQSRYYDPELGRFLNADEVDYLGTNSSLVSYNLFTYCVNNPIAASDPSGHFVIAILGVKIAVDSFALMCAFVAMLVPLLFNLMRDLPKIVRYFAGLIQDLVDALTQITKKALKAAKQYATAKHHIIARTAWRASYARMIWQGYKLDINDSRNLVPLNVVFHTYLHTEGYYSAVNLLVGAGNYNGKDGVLSVVLIIKTILKSFDRVFFG